MMRRNQRHDRTGFRRSTLSCSLKGVLIDATRGIQIKSFVDELIKQWFELPHQTVHAGMSQNTNCANDRKTLLLCHASYRNIVGQHSRCSAFERAGNHRTVYFRKVWNRESLDHRPISHRNDADPLVLKSLTKLSFPRTDVPLCDNFIDHLGNGRQLLEEIFEQVKLMNNRQMNERATVCNDRHGREVEGELRSVSSSLASHPSE